MEAKMMRTCKKGLAAGCVLLILIAATAPGGFAADESYRNNDQNDWKFYAGLYGWFLFINGSIEVNDDSTPIDVNFDNIWSQLHMAAFFEGEVQKGDFGVFTDLGWARLWQRNEDAFLNLNIKTDIDWVLLDFGLYWEAFNSELGLGSMTARLRLQPYFGGRYMFMGTEIKLRKLPNDPVLHPALNTAAPVLGLRAFLDFDEHWNLLFAADGGGFGVDAMESTWLAELQGGYRFRYNSWDLKLMAGYKAVGLNVARDRKDIAGDFIFHGPILTIGAEF
jgi:hypothetical protein